MTASLAWTSRARDDIPDPRGAGAWLTTKPKGRSRRVMVLTVDSVARRSKAEHWHGTRQKSAARTAADVAASSRPGVSMITTSKPADFALAMAWATSWDPIATRRGVSV